MLEQLPLAQFLVDSCSTAILRIRRDARISYGNDAAAQRLGYERHELQSLTVSDIYPAFPPDAWRTFWRRMNRERSLTFETQLRHKEGTPIPVEVRADLLDYEGDRFLFALFFDITKRKEAEETLRRTESIQRSIMESSHDTIILLDPRENIRFINRTTPDFTPDQVVNTPICQYVAEEFRLRMRECFRRVLQTGQPDGYQVDYTGPDGKTSIWESRVAPVWTDDQVTGLTVIARDETERKQADNALRESERSLAKAQQLAHIGSWEYDLATGQLAGSAELYRIIGLSNNETPPTLEAFISEFVHPDDREIIVRSFQNALTIGETEAIEFRVLRFPDRRVCYVRAQAEFISGPDGTPQKIIGTLQDITEQKKVELALRESEEKFRVLTEKSPAIVMITHGPGRIIYCNAAHVALTGYAEDELLGAELSDIVHPDYCDLVTLRHRQRLNGENPPQRYEIKIVTKGGEDRWLDLSAQLIEFEGDSAVLVTCVDISERKVTEERLREMESQLAHVSRLYSMGEMVAGIAHEINQPLSAIANFAQACENTVNTAGHEFDVPLETWLQEVNTQAVRCGDIIRRLRNFVKKVDSDREWVDLNRVVSDSIALIRSDLHHKSIAIECRLPNTGPRIHANQVELQQVFVNLLRNACDATCETTTPEITVHVELNNGCARVTVEDNGPGVEEAQQQKLFDAFFTTKPDGMGIGLAISRSIVEAHGGYLRFYPGTPSGAKFCIEFPAAEAATEGEQHVR